MRHSLAKRWRLEAVVVAAALTSSGIAWAQPIDAPAITPDDRPRVLLATPPKGSEDLSALLVGELSTLPLVVVTEVGDTPARTDADAVLRITNDPRAISVWTASTMRLRTYAADPRRPAGSDEALARQVAEVIRAELLLAPERAAEPTPEPPPPNAPSPPPRSPPVAAPAPPAPAPTVMPSEPPTPRSPRLADPMGAVTIAPAITISPGPLPVLPQMQLDVRAYVWRGLRAQLFGVLPLKSVVTEDERGDIVTTTGFAGASLGYDLLGPPFRLTPNLGAAWQWIGVTGRANPPFESSRDSAHAALLFAGLDADYAVTSWLSLTAGARVGAVTPTQRLAIAGDDLGAFGRPAVQLFAGLAVPIRGIAR